jgi:hypothetical protein
VSLDIERLRELSEFGFTWMCSRQDSRYPLFLYYFSEPAYQLSTISIVIRSQQRLPKAPSGRELEPVSRRHGGARLDVSSPLLWELNRFIEMVDTCAATICRSRLPKLADASGVRSAFATTAAQHRTSHLLTDPPESLTNVIL